jgi:hypothetical protein
MENLLNITLQALVTAVVPILTAMVVVVVKGWADDLKVKVGERRWFQVLEIVSASVKAAEQVGLANEALKLGAEKKKYALAMAQAALDQYGIKVDIVVLEGLIEKVVLEEIHKALD